MTLAHDSTLEGSILIWQCLLTFRFEVELSATQRHCLSGAPVSIKIVGIVANC